MAGPAEIGVELVETALTFAPWLSEIPVLGRILTAIAPHGGNEFQAIEQMQRQLELRKTDRQTRIEMQARYVIKASDAMQCVEDNLNNAGFLVALGRAILNTVAGRGVTAPEVLSERIFTCIESKVLKQTNARTKARGLARSLYGRPAKGHGHGRQPAENGVS